MAKNTKAKLEPVRLLIGKRLTSVCSEEQKRAAALHPQYGRLWQAIGYQASAGGKRLRPYLVVLATEAYSGEVTDTVIDVATAWELLHIGLLMHDDVIDRDYTRHGQPNVAGQYLEHYSQVSDQTQRTHYAQNAGLLAGDLAMAAAHRLLDRCNVPAEVKEIFYEANFQVIGGELLDMEAAFSNPPIDLELIAETKTASYSLIGPLLSGATLAAASAQQLALLRGLGRVLGVGFQLADDLLVFGDETKTGKSVDSDLAEGKRTMVVVEAMKLMSKTDRTMTMALLAHPHDANVPELRQLITHTDILNVLSIKLTDMAVLAHKIISQLDIKKDAKPKFEALVELLLHRTS